MKKILFIAVAILLQISYSAVSAQEVFKNDDLAISKLEQGVWVVETTDMTTMYIVEGTQRALLIEGDTTGSTPFRNSGSNAIISNGGMAKIVYDSENIN